MKNRLDAAPLNQLLHIALFESGINFWMSKGPWDTNHINSLSKLLVCRVLLSEPCHTILADEHFAPQIILLPGALYSSAHFNHRTTLELEYFALWNSLLPGTLYFLEQFAFSVPGSKGCWEGHLQISKVFQEAKCNKKQKRRIVF